MSKSGQRGGIKWRRRYGREKNNTYRTRTRSTERRGEERTKEEERRRELGG